MRAPRAIALVVQIGLASALVLAGATPLRGETAPPPESGPPPVPVSGVASPASAESLTIDEAVNLLGLFDAPDGGPSRARSDDEARPRRGGPRPERPAERAEASRARPAEPGPERAAGTAARTQPQDESGAEPTAVGWTQLREHFLSRARRIEALAREHLPRLAREALEDAKAGRVSRPVLQATGLLALLLVSVLWPLRRLSRGRGDVSVCLEYPAELRGTFCVRLSRRKASSRKARIVGPEEARRARDRAGSARLESHGVTREARFGGVPCDAHYVSVDGFFQTQDSDEVVATRFEEKEVQVQRGEAARIAFDLRPRFCPVEVKVCWDRRPVPDALVALRGAPGSLRSARGGAVNLPLSRGTHTLVVGSSDRVSEQAIEVASFQPIHTVIDLADREHVLFTGCPPAVQPYLNNDAPTAARELERDGQTALSHLLLARFHEERDQQESAARHYETAGELQRAAELRLALAQPEQAAALLERAGDDEGAAELFRSSGQYARAGEAYARAEDFASAAECFREVGDVERLIDALAKQGSRFAASQVALEHGDRSSAIRCLEQLVVTEPDYVSGAQQLAGLYGDEGHTDLAIRKLEELLATQGEEQTPIEAIDRLAQLLEQSGDIERALLMLERVRRLDAAFPNIATRIEALRKRRSAAQPGAVAAAAAGAGFSGEFRYEILEELGRGGMGIVFKARDRRLGRVVALKRLPDNLRDHPRAVDLFLREARAAAALNHPNIVTLFDAGQEGDTCYITMELLEGLPLNKILHQRGRLSTAHVAKLGGQIATGLQYAHEQGVVHRDIKTANLFFTHKKVVKVMDFGLAKMVEEVRRATTVIGGTPYYMAPEQAAGEQIDGRADVYALGITFYEMLTGVVPFREGDVQFHHRHTPPPDPRGAVGDIPPAMAELVLEMLAKKPEDRVASAGQVLARLQQIVS